MTSTTTILRAALKAGNAELVACGLARTDDNLILGWAASERFARRVGESPTALQKLCSAASNS